MPVTFLDLESISLVLSMGRAHGLKGYFQPLYNTAPVYIRKKNLNKDDNQPKFG
jgi:hypothetical protein